MTLEQAILAAGTMSVSIEGTYAARSVYCRECREPYPQGRGKPCQAARGRNTESSTGDH